MWWDVYRARGVFAGEKCVAGGAKNVFRGKRIVCARSGASWPRVCVCVSPPSSTGEEGRGWRREKGGGGQGGGTHQRATHITQSNRVSGRAQVRLPRLRVLEKSKKRQEEGKIVSTEGKRARQQMSV